MTFNIPTMSIV